MTELAQREFVEIQIGNSSDWPNGCIYLWFLFCLYLPIGAIDGETSGVCVSWNDRIHREQASEIDGRGTEQKRERERVGDWDEAIKRAHWKKGPNWISFQNSRLTKESTENALKTNFKLFSHYFPSNLCMTKAQMTNVWTLVTMTMHEFKNHLLYDCVCRLTIADSHTRTHFIHIARLAMHVFCALHTQCIHSPNDKFICIYALVSSDETIKLHIFLGSKIPSKCDCQKHFNRPFIIIIFFSQGFVCLLVCVCAVRASQWVYVGQSSCCLRLWLQWISISFFSIILRCIFCARF